MATKRSPAKQRSTSTKKSPAKSSAARSPTGPKTSAPSKTQTGTTKASGKAPGSKRAAQTTGARKYSPEASKTVARELHEMKHGTLRSGGSGEKVTNPKQAIAIALSEARRAGKKVPPNPNDPKKT